VTRFAVALVLAAAACQHPDLPDRPRELAQCRVSSRSPQDLVRCLAIDRNWPADSAAAEGIRAQATLDSIDAHISAEGAQVEQLRERCQADGDSIESIDVGADACPFTGSVVGARRAMERIHRIREIDRRWQACVAPKAGLPVEGSTRERCSATEDSALAPFGLRGH